MTKKSIDAEKSESSTETTLELLKMVLNHPRKSNQGITVSFPKSSSEIVSYQEEPSEYDSERKAA